MVTNKYPLLYLLELTPQILVVASLPNKYPGLL